jgi:predicted RNase H-like nuclease (RuvC/YqgF family)
LKGEAKDKNKCLSEEIEKVNKRNDKLKSVNANLKISKQQLINENNSLQQKVITLSRENNELKHRLNKFVSIKKVKSNSRSKNRGLENNVSYTAQKQLIKNDRKETKSIKSFKKYVFEKKKNSQLVCHSPRMKKVGSDRTLLPINQNSKGMFGRRETLDVNKNSRLLMYAINKESNTRNSELLNNAASEDDKSLYN